MPGSTRPGWPNCWKTGTQAPSSTLLSMRMSVPQLPAPSYCHAGMTPEQIAEVGPQLAVFTAGMLGGLGRSGRPACASWPSPPRTRPGR